jgi:hypothetical protein
LTAAAAKGGHEERKTGVCAPTAPDRMITATATDPTDAGGGAAASAVPTPPARPGRPPAAETSRLYAGDWAAFESWCRHSGAQALPASAASAASAASVESFLASLAASHRPGSLVRRRAAIADQHRRHGHVVPKDPAIRSLLRHARQAVTPQHRPLVIGPAQLCRMAACCPGDGAGLRDRALLLLFAASGLGRPGAVPRRSAAADPDATAGPVASVSAPGLGPPLRPWP